MKNIKSILSTLGGLSLLALALFLMFSSAKSDEKRLCQGVVVRILDEDSQLLVKEADVLRWATSSGSEPLKGMNLQSINLKKLERRVENSGIIKDCQAYTDLHGNLILKVEVYKPLARILGSTRFPDRYMDENGRFFPVSKNYTPTVLLLSGTYFNKRKGLESAENQDLLQLIKTVATDEFWSAQITRMDVDAHKEVKLEPLLGEHIVEFGKPQKVKTKMDKLLVFYTKILPQDPWSKFQEVSVKYDGQIVCR
jgi:cell division protein FtsQ